MWFDFEIFFLPSFLSYWAQSAYSVLYPSARSLLHIFLLPILSSFEGGIRKRQGNRQGIHCTSHRNKTLDYCNHVILSLLGWCKFRIHNMALPSRNPCTCRRTRGKDKETPGGDTRKLTSNSTEWELEKS